MNGAPLAGGGGGQKATLHVHVYTSSIQCAIYIFSMYIVHV